ncbi:MAG: S24/S26 family peptidase [Deltaproteobacteria bacterium]|nr:S24/S26 family peptidase [Deltaproteobacteria bacterium]
MNPFLQSGDILEIELIRGSQAHLGDVLLVVQDKKRPVSRVISRACNELVLRPDNHLAQIIRCPKSQIVGLVVSLTRRGKQISRTHFFWKAAALKNVLFWRLGLKNMSYFVRTIKRKVLSRLLLLSTNNKPL